MLLITPPFTQLNTPYPATAYLKGYLNTINVSSFQIDLGLEVVLDVFSRRGLSDIFNILENSDTELSENGYRIFSLRKRYINTIDSAISFIQNSNQTLATTICAGGFLPQASRFNNETDLEWAFGTMGLHDKARHLVTLYLEDLGDLITEAIDPHFGFSRYAERLGRTASSFSDLYSSIKGKNSFITNRMLELLQNYIKEKNPKVVCITVPFPGNLFGALKCGEHIKKHHPNIKVVLGGGYANTELRKVSDIRVFEFIDFITLDDGETPLQNLLEHLNGKRDVSELKRTFVALDGSVLYVDGSQSADVSHANVGTPDYSNLLLNKYLSVIEVANPMHKLWSDGRWNKMTLAHGCYWGGCSFCDVSLDYIKRYEPATAQVLCDRIEDIISQTGQIGFHFVDEAAPPVLLRDLALEILRRELIVVWWTNVRFEKRFTPDLCRLLRASGCIAVSGGLEVASDRLLKKMNKGVTVSQVARVTHSLTNAGIMVHAYLMYGFPTQTDSETINSLEMVRQLFQAGVVQSGFWHQFAMTAHSAVGLNPESFGAKCTGPIFGGFAENDLFHQDENKSKPERFSEGLKHSLYNYMHGVALDEPLDTWFNFKVPNSTVDPHYIQTCIEESQQTNYKENSKVVWIGGELVDSISSKIKRGKEKINYVELIFSGNEEDFALFFEEKTSFWVTQMLEIASGQQPQSYSFAELKESFISSGLLNFEEFINSQAFQMLKDKGLLLV